ncbi:hypothetical protein Pcinc_021364 [Petrolisthes cinctipes]|uniref:Uncharacterized protein n=1 Tax=Petrolisthes cinctipes TaxID=88211 RepID=A0AAE1KJY3_PETCI|nr:hypothetical protein Pcinc_021364 [Petrolisthes cinctipes]
MSEREAEKCVARLVDTAHISAIKTRMQLDQLDEKVLGVLAMGRKLPQDDQLPYYSMAKDNLQTILKFHHFIQYTAEKHMEDYHANDSDVEYVPVAALPRIQVPLPEISLRGEKKVGMLCYVTNPTHFYIHLLNSETSSLERFHDVMLERYNTDTEPIQAAALPVGSCWAARWTNNKWYRVRVSANLHISDQEHTTKDLRVKVNFIDYGGEGTVKIKNIRYLHEEFTLLSASAIPCCLTEVYPVYGWQSDWTNHNIRTFVQLCGGIMNIIYIHFQELELHGRYSVMLETLAGEVINKELVDKGCAVSQKFKESTCVVETLEQQKVPDKDKTADEILKNWDPMDEAHKISKLPGNTDNECVESVLLGWKNTDESRLCKYFCRGWTCPRGDACRWEHTRLRGGITVQKQEAICATLEPGDLPSKGLILAVVVTSVMSPTHFFAHFPFGLASLQDLHQYPKEETELQLLHRSMQQYYNKQVLHEPNSLLPTLGGIYMLCKSNDGVLDCTRVTVVDVEEEEEEDTAEEKIQVFYVDYGYKELVKSEELYPLAVQFSHLAPQVMECYLYGVSFPHECDQAAAMKCLQELSSGHTLVAKVRELDRSQQQVGVVLYNTEDNQDININKVMKEFASQNLQY